MWCGVARSEEQDEKVINSCKVLNYVRNQKTRRTKKIFKL